MQKWTDIEQTADCRCCKGTGKTYDHRAIGRSVQIARKAAGLKLRDVSIRSGYTVSYISDLEQGRRNWNGDLYDRITTAIELPTRELCEAIYEVVVKK